MDILELMKKYGAEISEDKKKDFDKEFRKTYKHESELSTANAKIDNLQTQLADASKRIEDFKGMDIEGIKKAADEWKDKAEKADEANKAKIAELENDFAAKDAANSLKFSSESAKRAFIGDLRAKKLTLQDGKFLGFEDFVEGYKKSDAAAFAEDTSPGRFVASTPGAKTVGSDANKNEQANAALRAVLGKE